MTIIDSNEYYNYLYINYNIYNNYTLMNLLHNYDENDNWSIASTTDCADYDDLISLIDTDNNECWNLVDSDEQ